MIIFWYQLAFLKHFTHLCNVPENLNLTLPNLNLHLDREGFHSFADLIESHAIRLNNRYQSVFIETPYKGLSLHFTGEQLDDLMDVIIEAKLQLELKEIHAWVVYPSKYGSSKWEFHYNSNLLIQCWLEYVVLICQPH